MVLNRPMLILLLGFLVQGLVAQTEDLAEFLSRPSRDLTGLELAHKTTLFVDTQNFVTETRQERYPQLFRTAFAQAEQTGTRLAMVGMLRPSGSAAVRVVVEEGTFDLWDYARAVEMLNSGALTVMVPQQQIQLEGQSAIYWEYLSAGMHFVEVIISFPERTARLAFWTVSSFTDLLEDLRGRIRRTRIES